MIVAGRARHGPGAATLPNDERGSTTVEFALAGGLTIMTLVACLEVSVAAIAEEFLDLAAEQVMRSVRVGAYTRAGATGEAVDGAVCATLPPIFDCGKLSFDIWAVGNIGNVESTIPIDEDGELLNPDRRELGAEGDIVAVRVYYPWPTFLEALRPSVTRLADGSRLLIATRIQRNELYAE